MAASVAGVSVTGRPWQNIRRLLPGPDCLQLARRTLEISCEAAIWTGLVSCIPLFYGAPAQA